MMQPKEIRLQQDVFKQKLIVKRLYKEAKGLLVKNKELRSALFKIHSHIFDIQDGHSISSSDGEIIDIVNTALEDGES